MKKTSNRLPGRSFSVSQRLDPNRASCKHRSKLWMSLKRLCFMIVLISLRLCSLQLAAFPFSQCNNLQHKRLKTWHLLVFIQTLKGDTEFSIAFHIYLTAERSEAGTAFILACSRFSKYERRDGSLTWCTFSRLIFANASYIIPFQKKDLNLIKISATQKFKETLHHSDAIVTRG